MILQDGSNIKKSSGIVLGISKRALIVKRSAIFNREQVFLLDSFQLREFRKRIASILAFSIILRNK